MAEDVKAILYAWCGRKKMGAPHYDTQTMTGGRGQQRFRCELRVESHDYVGMGNSTNKKDAATNAARDFCQYLVREGLMAASDIPQFNQSSIEGGASDGWGGPPQAEVAPSEQWGEWSGNGNGQSNAPSAPSTESTASGQVFGAPWRPPPSAHQNYVDQLSAKRAEEVTQSESVDFRADIHGGWTLDNCKQRLNEFSQKTKQHLVYEHKPVGPDHNKSFVAELNLFVPQLHRKLHAREQGSTKKMASASCALSMVRQLFHHGVVEKYGGPTSKKKDTEELPEYQVAVNPDVEKQLSDYLDNMGVCPVACPPTATKEAPVSLLTDVKLDEFPVSKPFPAGVVSWCPPLQNWNPWRGSNIDEGPLAFVSILV
uniref:RNA helicase n=1 Tax=Plectus sambesii TaxID=2011161 RepID=A0A914VJY0_9BILA